MIQLKFVFKSTCFWSNQEANDPIQICVLNWIVSDWTERKMIQLEVVVESTCFWFDQEEIIQLYGIYFWIVFRSGLCAEELVVN